MTRSILITGLIVISIMGCAPGKKNTGSPLPQADSRALHGYLDSITKQHSVRFSCAIVFKECICTGSFLQAGFITDTLVPKLVQTNKKGKVIIVVKQDDKESTLISALNRSRFRDKFMIYREKDMLYERFGMSFATDKIFFNDDQKGIAYFDLKPENHLAMLDRVSM